MKHIIMFDFDGVIADSLAVFRASMTATLARYGYRCMETDDAFLALFDDNLYTSLERAGVSPEDLPRILGEVAARLTPEVPQLPMFAGMKEALRVLAASCTLYLISSNHTQPVRAFLRHHGLLDLFAAVLGADVNPSKVAKIQGIRTRHPGPGTCLIYVGDTAGDMREARTAGVLSAAAAWGWHARERLLSQTPDVILDEPSDLSCLPELAYRVGPCPAV